MYLITVFENTLHEVHENPVGMIFDFLLAEKLVKEALLKDNPESKVDCFNIGKGDRSYCYTNGNISYTIHELKEIKEVSDLKYEK